MKNSLFLAASVASAVSAFTVPLPGQFPALFESAQKSVGSVHSPEHETFLVEYGPGKTEWITEDRKWELRRVRGFPGRNTFGKTTDMSSSKGSTSWISQTHLT